MTETTELPTASAGNSTEAPAAAATTAAQAGGGLAGLKLAQLQALASQLGITGGSRMRKSDLVAAISSHQRGGSVADRKQAEDTSGTAATARSDSKAGADSKSTGADDGAAAPKRRSRGTKTASGQVEQKQAEQSADQKQADSSADQSTDQKQTATSAAGTEGGAPERPARRTRSRRAESAAGATGEDQSASAEPSSEAASESRNGTGDGADQGNDGQQERSNDRNARGDRNNRSGRGDRNDRNSRNDRNNDRSDRNNERSERNADRQQDNRSDSNRSDNKSDNDQQSGSRGTNRNNDRNERNNDRDEDSRRNRRNRNRNDRNRNRRGRSGPEVDDTEMTEDDVLLPVAGILDVLDNYAFVRTSGYLPGPNDVYVSLSMVKKYGLRKGDAVVGAIRAPRDGESQNSSNNSASGGNRQKFNALVRLTSVNGQQAEDSPKRTKFNDLVPLYPQERLRLETDSKLVGPRVIDLVSPIGKGQRGLIVSPPKAGKTMILQSIANAVTTNNPEVHLMMVLVDERPEEVTDMQRSVKGEVIASTFDRPADDHTTVAELAIERAKRLVEMGRDVVVLLDSMTRLGRAYNLAAPASGRILSGGVDSSALYPPKRFFGAARNIENGGSLTILATALVETGSKMDEVIFEEFKGTGNMELRLSRQLADKRIFPAVDVNASGTRREENLLTSDEIKIMWKLRRVLSGLDTQQALEILTNKIRETQSNAEFLMLVSKTTLGSKGEK
ncbi:transcription termination factor Rho [Citricoccus sp. K5]|uniref:transcription termination factor Rho n=1 Tax=Citricoccus sp. K5 TaxID=2653135 RepID=UPI0012F1411B|nr:transcription termination factor Rho [Citricoccus sp. K5]VXB16264.1 Transcription termination factor Rho [Citricoccus sp. K5]